jgi:hypothetical protein
MWELYYEHPIIGEVFITMITSFKELDDYPDSIEGCPLKYRYLEDDLDPAGGTGLESHR